MPNFEISIQSTIVPVRKCRISIQSTIVPVRLNRDSAFRNSAFQSRFGMSAGIGDKNPFFRFFFLETLNRWTKWLPFRCRRLRRCLRHTRLSRSAPVLPWHTRCATAPTSPFALSFRQLLCPAGRPSSGCASAACWQGASAAREFHVVICRLPT